MAEMTIQLRVDPTTGKKNVVITYESDADAMPMEHEDEHRELIDKLLEGGVLKASELGTITVERLAEKTLPEVEKSAEAEAQRESVEQSS